MPPIRPPLKIAIYSHTDGGHRASYLAFFIRLFHGERIPRRQILFCPRPVLFLLIEDTFALYFAASILRALTGRRTIGLMFRPKPALEDKNLRLRLKRCALKILKRIKAVQTLTILPFTICPDFETIADGWIYDPQLWDITTEEHARYSTLRTEKSGFLHHMIDAADRHKPVLSAIGRQTQSKGFDIFTDAHHRHPALRRDLTFCFAGKAAMPAPSQTARFMAQGGLAVDRLISDAEIIETYAASDLIWCFYAPHYDQASGILGRAVQFGIPVLVRQDSLIHKLCLTEGIPCVAAHDDTLAASLSAPLPAQDHTAGQKHARRFEEHSIATITRIFQNAPSGRGTI